MKTLYGTCLAASVSDTQGNAHDLCLFDFVLLDARVPFLLVIQDQRRLGLDFCLRVGDASSVRISQ